MVWFCFQWRSQICNYILKRSVKPANLQMGNVLDFLGENMFLKKNLILKILFFNLIKNSFPGQNDGVQSWVFFDESGISNGVGFFNRVEIFNGAGIGCLPYAQKNFFEIYGSLLGIEQDTRCNCLGVCLPARNIIFRIHDISAWDMGDRGIDAGIAFKGNVIIILVS